MEGLEPSPGPSVRVRHGLGDLRRPITLIHAWGEHDFRSRGILTNALAPLEGHVVVDLTRCTYLDSAVIGAILGKALALGKAGYRLEVVVPSSGSISTRFARLGVHNLVSVLDALPRLYPAT